jgi:malate synthase
MPDRSAVNMEQPFMRAYTDLVVKTCHRRGVHAMGGMAAQIPIKSDAEANLLALDKVRQDKLREVKGGHDGTWVAHPGLVALAREVFDRHMDGPNQIGNLREDVVVSEAELVAVPTGKRSLSGLRHCVRVGVQYVEAWLRGQGCVPLYHLMEDAATAEICRAQIWQWLKHEAVIESETVNRAFFRGIVSEEMEALGEAMGPERMKAGLFEEAARLFESLCVSEEFDEFLTLKAYDELVAKGQMQ